MKKARQEILRSKQERAYNEQERKRKYRRDIIIDK